jgi:hypothetical protein
MVIAPMFPGLIFMLEPLQKKRFEPWLLIDHAPENRQLPTYPEPRKACTWHKIHCPGM